MALTKGQKIAIGVWAVLTAIGTPILFQTLEKNAPVLPTAASPVPAAEAPVAVEDVLCSESSESDHQLIYDIATAQADIVGYYSEDSHQTAEGLGCRLPETDQVTTTPTTELWKGWCSHSNLRETAANWHPTSGECYVTLEDGEVDEMTMVTDGTAVSINASRALSVIEDGDECLVNETDRLCLFDLSELMVGL